MKLKTKLLLCLVTLLLLTVSISSCSQTDIYVDDDTDESPLQVYLSYGDYYEKDAIHKYNKEVALGNIDSRKIEITEFQYEEIENMYDKIANEIMSGEGPDIIFVDGTLDRYLDFVKISEQNAFADMDILIEKSETFSFDEYNKAAVDVGIINDKRVMLPLSYKVNYIVTTQENLDKINTFAPDYLTYQNFFEIIEKCHNDTDSIGSLYSTGQLYYNLISKEGLETQGIEDLKKYIDLLSVDREKMELLGDIGGFLEDFYQHICNGEILMNHIGNTSGSGGEFDLLNGLYNIVENLYDKTFVILNEPTINDKTSYGYIDLGCVININSKHKNDAFKFVEFILSEQCQYGYTLRTPTIPVNIAAYESAKSDFMKDVFCNRNKVFHEKNHEYSLTPLPDTVKDTYINLVEGVSEYKYIGGERYIFTYVISDSIGDYMNHKIDFDTMIEEINRKIKLYYSE